MNLYHYFQCTFFFTLFCFCWIQIFSIKFQVILASRSDYFRALLYGGLKETNQVIS